MGPFKDKQTSLTLKKHKIPKIIYLHLQIHVKRAFICWEGVSRGKMSGSATTTNISSIVCISHLMSHCADALTTTAIFCVTFMQNLGALRELMCSWVKDCLGDFHFFENDGVSSEMGPYDSMLLTLRLERAGWFRVISGPLLPQKGLWKAPTQELTYDKRLP